MAGLPLLPRGHPHQPSAIRHQPSLHPASKTQPRTPPPREALSLTVSASRDEADGAPPSLRPRLSSLTRSRRKGDDNDPYRRVEREREREDSWLPPPAPRRHGDLSRGGCEAYRNPIGYADADALVEGPPVWGTFPGFSRRANGHSQKGASSLPFESPTLLT